MFKVIVLVPLDVPQPPSRRCPLMLMSSSALQLTDKVTGRGIVLGIDMKRVFLTSGLQFLDGPDPDGKVTVVGPVELRVILAMLMSRVACSLLG